MIKIRKNIPQYVFTLFALIVGILLGGFFSTELAFLGKGISTFLDGFITIVPLIIFFVLSPAVASLVRSGKGGKLAAYTVCWYIFTSIVAGLLGVLISTLLFELTPSGRTGGFQEVIHMFSLLNGDIGASLPLLSILVAVLVGLLSLKITRLDHFLQSVQNIISNSSKYFGYFMIPLILFLGISLGIKSGVKESFNYYAFMTLYTFALCLIWWVIYLLIVVKGLSKQQIKPILTKYYYPTAIFAAGTCSSLATLPINLDRIKKYGVKKEIADFILPVGSIINLDTSALAYVAYAPFIMTFVFDMQVSWTILLMAWPAIVLFTIAAPGLPAGMGTALWSSTLFASMMGLTGETKTDFIATWIALSGGIPDMLRTATNCTSDGFTAILFNKYFKENTINSYDE